MTSYPTGCHLPLGNLHTDEVLVVINLAGFPRHDCVTVDRNLTPTGSQMTDLLGGVAKLPSAFISSSLNALLFLFQVHGPRCKRRGSGKHGEGSLVVFEDHKGLPRLL